MAVNKKLDYNSNKHNRVRDAVLARRDYSRDQMEDFHHRWQDAERQSMAYMPKSEVDKHRENERDGGNPQYTTIEVPYSYALMMTAYTYWSSVFLSRTPIFQYTGRHGETQNAVQAVEAVVNYQIHVGQNMVPLHSWFFDAARYGIGIVGCYWDEQTETISEMKEKPKEYLGIPIPGTEKKVKETREVEGYKGNKLFNIRPYDFRPDPRVSLKRFQDGEFCGRRTDVGWNVILHGKDEKYMNVEELKEQRAKAAAQRSENREEGAEPMEEPDYEGYASNLSREDLQTIELEEMVVEISPKEWELGDREKPEKWLFTVANDDVLIECRPLGYQHNRFPFQVIEYEPDAHQLSTQGMMDVVRPLNDAMTWLFNQHFYNVRRALNDQFVADPSRIVMKDMMSNEPGMVVRAKPAAYGQDIRQAVQQFPVQDVTRAHMDDSNTIAELMQRVVGITDNIMGQVNDSGRRTATEVRSSNTASLNRLKSDAEFFSAMGFEPLGQMMIQNTQQFYDQETMFNIAGNNAKDAEGVMQVTPQDILGFYDVVPVDGTLPIDRFAMSNLFKEMVNDLTQVPEAAQSFDIIGMYEHAMELAGVRNTEQFRVETVPDQEMQQRAQNGESIPLQGGGGGSTGGGDANIAEREAGRPREPGQIPGMGQTL